MFSAWDVQLSRPDQTRHISVDQRSLGFAAIDGSAWILGWKPIGRLRTCQPLSWKMRWTVFLLNPSNHATVRYPKNHQTSGRLSKKKHSGRTAGAMYSMSFADTPQAKKLSRHCRTTMTIRSISWRASATDKPNREDWDKRL